MEIGEPVPVQHLPLRTGKRTIELELRSRTECRELIAAIARASFALPDDGDGLLMLMARNGEPEPAPPADEAFAAHLSHPKAEPIASMSGSDVAETHLDGRDRRELESLLLHISGYCPAAFATAIARFPRHIPEPLPQRTPGSTPTPPGLLCDCGNRLPWPVAGSDTECGCGNVWEHDGVDIGAGARLKTSRRKADTAPAGEPPMCALADPENLNRTCARLDGHEPPHRTLNGGEWDDGPEPYHATSGPQCAARDDGWICTAQRGHGGPWHIAYSSEGIEHRWPVTDDYHPSRWTGTVTEPEAGVHA